MKQLTVVALELIISSLAHAEPDKPLVVLPNMTTCVSEPATFDTTTTQLYYKVSTSFVVTNRTDERESVSLNYSSPGMNEETDDEPGLIGFSDVLIFINGEEDYYWMLKPWSAPVFVPAKGCSTNTIEFYVNAEDTITNICATFSLFVSPERRRNEKELEANVLDVIIKSTEIPCKTFSDVSQER